MFKNINSLTKKELLKEITQYPNIIKFLEKRPIDILIKAFDSLVFFSMTQDFFPILNENDINKEFIKESLPVNKYKLFMLGTYLIKNNKKELIPDLITLLSKKDYGDQHENYFFLDCQNHLTIKDEFFKYLKKEYPTINDFFANNSNLYINTHISEILEKNYKKKEIVAYFKENNEQFNLFLTGNGHPKYIDNIASGLNVVNYLYQHKDVVYDKIINSHRECSLLMYNPSLFIRCADDNRFRTLFLSLLQKSKNNQIDPTYFINKKYLKETNELLVYFYENNQYNYYSLKYIIDTDLFQLYDASILMKQLASFRRYDYKFMCTAARFLEKSNQNIDLKTIHSIVDNYNSWLPFILKNKTKFTGLNDVLESVASLGIEIKTLDDLKKYIPKDTIHLNHDLTLE